MISSVLIDIDDTLLDFKLCSRQAVLKACEKYSLPFSNELMDGFYEITHELWSQVENGKLTKPELYKKRFSMVFERFGISCDGEIFEKIYHEELFESDIIIDGARELLEWLSARFKVYAASNAPHAQQLNRLKKAGLLPYFSRVFTSELIGFEKPSEKFFEAILDETGALPKETLMIGDSLNADIGGGLKCGLHTCLFTRKKYTPKDGVIPEYIVEALTDIPKLSLFS